MSWSKSFLDWTKTGYTFGDLGGDIKKFGIRTATLPFKDAGTVMSGIWNFPIKGKKSSYYPTGKASLKQLYSGEGYKKAGEFMRKEATSKVGGFSKGFLGEGGYNFVTGKQGMYPDFFPGGSKGQIFGGKDPDNPGIIDKIGGTFDAATGRIQDPLKGFDIPKINDIGAGIGDGMSDFATALAMGLGSLGQGIGGGLPEMPSMQLIGEDGEPNILMIGGLAAVAYIVLKGGNNGI